jgi:tetratricopeptide (TPR) repeat protein
MWALWSYRCVRANFDGALEIAEELIERSQVASQDVALAAGLQARGTTLWHLGRLEDSAGALESALEQVEGVDPEELERTGLTHMPILARCHTSHPFFLLGRAEEAERHVRRALAAADRQRDPFNHAISAMFAGWLAALGEDHAAAVHWLDDSVRICDEYGFRQLAAIATAPLGWAQAMNGDPGTGIPTLEGAIAAATEQGSLVLLRRAEETLTAA